MALSILNTSSGIGSNSTVHDIAAYAAPYNSTVLYYTPQYSTILYLHWKYTTLQPVSLHHLQDIQHLQSPD